MVSHLEKKIYQDPFNTDNIELLQLLQKIENLQIRRDQNIRLITKEIQNSLSIFRGLLTSLKSVELSKCNQATEDPGSTTLILQKWELSYMEAIANTVRNTAGINTLYLKALKDSYINKRKERCCVCGIAKRKTSHRQ